MHAQLKQEIETSAYLYELVVGLDRCFVFACYLVHSTIMAGTGHESMKDFPRNMWII